MTTSGTSSGRVQSAVLVPVPEADPKVGRWRREYDPVAVAGVPAHVTLVVPWLPPAELNDKDLDELDHILADQPAFDFRLARVGWFGRSVLWLAPEPAEPFHRLTWRVADAFGTAPWDGEYDEVVPHLTVGHASDGSELATVAERLEPLLPITCRAREAWVMVGDGERWTTRHTAPLGRSG